MCSSYNYSREDEEIYKEFLEIANDLIPHIVRLSSEEIQHSGVDVALPGGRPLPLLHDPECYMLLLKFYDGICKWEEGSSTPVLHITWAKHFVFSMTKFDCRARENLDIEVERDEDEKGEGDEEKGEMKEEVKQEEPWRDEKKAKKDGAVLSAIKIDVSNVENVEPKQRRGRGRPPKHKASIDKTNGVVSTDVIKLIDDDVNSVDSDSCVKRQFSVADDNRKRDHDASTATSDEENIKSAIEELASKVAVDGGEESRTESPNPNIAALAHACGESILNPEYLLGVGEPFSAASTTVNLFSTTTPGTDTRVDFNEFLSSRSNGTSFPGMTMDSMLKADSPAGGMLLPRSDSSVWSTPTIMSETTSRQSSRPGSRLECRNDTKLVLRSAKMKALKDLLLAEKLNSSAIKLQLTAQSQVHLKHTKVAGDKVGNHDWGVGRKRTRRD